MAGSTPKDGDKANKNKPADNAGKEASKDSPAAKGATTGETKEPEKADQEKSAIAGRLRLGEQAALMLNIDKLPSDKPKNDKIREKAL